MADDTSYSTFLTKANEDPNSGHSAEKPSTSQARGKFDPSISSSSSDAVPAPLRAISTTYTSDTDSDFEPVFFSYASDQLPGVGDFRDVLGTKGKDVNIQELSIESWDPRGQYKEVVEKVESAGSKSGGGTATGTGKATGTEGGSGVKVFRVEVGGTRVEYYVLTVGERKLVGVVAKAVES